MKTVGLVSCSSSKLDHPARAEDLYCSALFKKSLAYAKKECDEVFILSALYGLVELDREICPYDRKLQRKDSERWALQVARELIPRFGRNCTRYIMLAGKEYTEPLVEALVRFDGYGRNGNDGWSGFTGEIQRPLDGLSMGKRLSFLNSVL